jgi:deoxyribodipyrimidine photo-lyase
MKASPPVNLFWFRRDLRFEDNQALSVALSGDLPVLALFIFDSDILDDLPADDKRVSFIHEQLVKMNQTLARYQSTLLVYCGSVDDVFQQVCREYNVKAVFCNRDYEPSAIERDGRIQSWLKAKHINFKAYKDQVIYEKNQVLKQDRTPYTVFTPYMKKWKAKLNSETDILTPKVSRMTNFLQIDHQPVPDLESFGFASQSVSFPSGTMPDPSLLRNYQRDRDFPAIKGTSRLSVHLRFGTVSIRKLVAAALENSDTWLNELIWREFYMMILWHFPHVVHSCFKPAYNHIQWRNNQQDFERWCQGETGYPIVDAGMRELNQTGFMHNRLRMITASFLCKHLLISWQWGEAYFAEKLLDFELSSNNGGWQWSAGCGCDAAPYFRVFNPWIQAKKFDPDGIYTKKWVPEHDQPGYPEPMVEHKFARNRAIEIYQKSLQKQSFSI